MSYFIPYGTMDIVTYVGRHRSQYVLVKGIPEL